MGAERSGGKVWRAKRKPEWLLGIGAGKQDSRAIAGMRTVGGNRPCWAPCQPDPQAACVLGGSRRRRARGPRGCSPIVLLHFEQPLPQQVLPQSLHVIEVVGQEPQQRPPPLLAAPRGPCPTQATDAPGAAHGARQAQGLGRPRARQGMLEPQVCRSPTLPPSAPRNPQPVSGP